MTEIAKLYYSFWNEILPSYPEYDVPADAEMPYITYTLSEVEVFTDGLKQVRLWTYSKSYEQYTKYCDIIKQKIPQRIGAILTTSNKKGYVSIKRGDGNFIQRQPMDEPDLKVAYINFIVRCYIPDNQFTRSD